MWIRRISFIPWFSRKIVDPLLQILRRGAEPKQLALSVAIGSTLGIFPIVGVPVFLCGVAIALLGSLCNAPTVMLTNLVVTPIELSLVVPFLRLGETITGGPHFPLTSDAFKKALTGQASNEVLFSIVNALLGWLVASPFIFAVLYPVLIPFFKFIVYKFSPPPSSPRIQLGNKFNPPPSSPKPIHSLTEVSLKIRDV